MSRNIKVKLISPKNIFSLILPGDEYDRQLVPVEDEPDILVVDSRGFPDIMEMANHRQTFSVPALFLLRNSREIAAVFPRLLPGDDICLVREFRQTAAFRIVRLYGDGSGKTPMHFYKRMLTTDALTGLQNRRALDETLGQWSVGVSPSNPLSSILLDLDHFKAINDDYGHSAGDRVLVEVANILKPHISDEIQASRFGGEEMLILMKADNGRACEFAEFLRKEIENGIDPPGDSGPKGGPFVTASFGVSTVRDEESAGESLIKAADVLLYRAKSNGRNRVEGEEPRDDEDSGLLDEDAVLRDFEARLKVTTDRLVEYLTHRSRKLVGHYRKEADRDGMTGLYRKEFFTRRFAREFDNARKENGSLTLLFLDIDDFGNVNRSYGYPTGDSTLKKVSAVMLDSVRNVDWTARYGGEELCIIMPSTHLDEAKSVAERVRSQVEALQVTAYDGRQFGVTVSIGLAELSDTDAAPVDLIQRASDKTREAKKAGKNNVKF